MGDKAITTLKGSAWNGVQSQNIVRNEAPLPRTGLSHTASLGARQAWFKDTGLGQAETPNRSFLS